MNASEIYNMVYTAWPAECPSVSRIRAICQEFNDGRDSFKRKNGSGRRKSDERLHAINEVRELVENDRTMSIRRIANALNIPHAMVQRILSDDLERKWFHTAWVPHTLSDANKAIRVERCENLLICLESRLAKSNLVTIDEKFFYQRKLQPKHNIGSWLSAEDIINAAGDQIVEQTAVRSPMEAKWLVIVAVSQRGYHYFKILNRNETLNAEKYTAFMIELENYLIRQPEPILPENMRLIQDNARPHVANVTANHMAEKHIRLLRQPPYSPDVNLCDSYIFPRLESLRRGDFESSEELRQFLITELPNFTPHRMTNALNNSMDTMRRIIAAGGSYL